MGRVDLSYDEQGDAEERHGVAEDACVGEEVVCEPNGEDMEIYSQADADAVDTVVAFEAADRRGGRMVDGRDGRARMIYERCKTGLRDVKTN
jgi:hypothetical protein